MCFRTYFVFCSNRMFGRRKWLLKLTDTCRLHSMQRAGGRPDGQPTSNIHSVCSCTKMTSCKHIFRVLATNYKPICAHCQPKSRCVHKPTSLISRYVGSRTTLLSIWQANAKNVSGGERWWDDYTNWQTGQLLKESWLKIKKPEMMIYSKSSEYFIWRLCKFRRKNNNIYDIHILNTDRCVLLGLSEKVFRLDRKFAQSINCVRCVRKSLEAKKILCKNNLLFPWKVECVGEWWTIQSVPILTQSLKKRKKTCAIWLMTQENNEGIGSPWFWKGESGEESVRTKGRKWRSGHHLHTPTHDRTEHVLAPIKSFKIFEKNMENSEIKREKKRRKKEGDFGSGAWDT